MDTQINHEKWVNQVTNYPDKALINVLHSMDKELQHRLEKAHAQLDGAAWSPKDWNKINNEIEKR